MVSEVLKANSPIQYAGRIYMPGETLPACAPRAMVDIWISSRAASYRDEASEKPKSDGDAQKGKKAKK